MSEQTLYTIAHDIAEFKEFSAGKEVIDKDGKGTGVFDDETIVHQDEKSCYNLHYLMTERNAMNSLKNKNHEYKLSQKLT